MVPPTAEWTTQIPPTSVAGMREEPNPTVRAVCDAPLKLGMGVQDRVQRGLILLDKRSGAIVLVPIRAKREKPLDGYGKKARLSVTMWIVLCTPSSYPLDANASRGRARFFVRNRQGTAGTATPMLRYTPFPQTVLFAESPRPRCASDRETTTWKK